MQYPRKKSFAAEQLKRQQSKKPRILVVVGIMAMVVVIGIGYAFFSRYQVKLELVPETIKIETEEVKSIAVLPFKNISADEEQEYFCDGMSEEIINALTNVKGLNVTARTSAFKFKGKDMDIPEIGNQLNVQAVLEGSVRKSGKSLRITTQLINVKDGFHLWSEQYDREMKDIFEIQSDVAQKVVLALKAKLSTSEKDRLEEKPTNNLEAYDYYLRGNYYNIRSYKEENRRIAVQMYQKAIDLDPEFALAYARLSQTQSMMYWYYYDRSEECLTKAKEAVDKALQLNPELPDAHLALGYYYYWGHLDYEPALKQFTIARESMPNYSEVLAAICFVQRRQGNFNQALANIKKASELDPLSHFLAFEVGCTFHFMRKYPEAERYYNQAISLAPDWYDSYFEKAILYLCWEGNTEKARAVLEKLPKNANSTNHPDIVILIDMYNGNYQMILDKLTHISLEAFESQFTYITKSQLIAQIYGQMNNVQLEQAFYDSARIVLKKKIQEHPEDPRFHSSLGIAYAGLGRKEDAIWEGKLGVELHSVSKEAIRGLNRIEDLARIYVMIGEYDNAFDHLEFLLSRPGYMTIHILRLDPIWATLHEHPRFKALLKKMGFPED